MPLSDPPTILFGDMAQHNQSTTVTISSTSVFVEIPSGYSGNGTGFVFQNDKELKCVEPGDYMLNWNISLNLASGANNNMIGGVLQDGSIKFLTTAHGFISAANDLINVSGTGILTIAIDELISLGIRNLDTTNDFVVEHAAITLFKVQ